MPGNKQTVLELEVTEVDADARGLDQRISDIAVKEKTFTADTTTDGAGVYAYDTTGSTVTLTLSSDDISAERVIVVKDKGGGAGTNAITVNTEGSENIDGSTSTTISSNYGKLRIYCDGSNAFTF